MEFFIPVARAGVVADAPPIASVFLNAFLFILGIAGILMVISIVLSGFISLLSLGDVRTQERAKKALVYSIVGAFVILGAFVLVRFVGSAIQAEMSFLSKYTV